MDVLTSPNLNTDVYRNMTITDRPPLSYKHLQFINIYNEKSAILGASNLTDRYWNGAVWYYNDIKDFDRDKAFRYAKTESGVCDGVFLQHDKFVIGQDSGTLQVFDLSTKSDDSKELKCAGYATLHDSCLLTLSAFADKGHVVSGGMDCCIKIWDISELMATCSFSFAHTDLITCVDVKPGSNTEFASTSYDCEALMWDIRLARPAQSILKKNIGLTAICWSPNKPNIVAIGTDGAEVIIVDIRKGGLKLLSKSIASSRPIHKLVFNPDSGRVKELAVCCDDVSVEMLDANNQLSLIYRDDRHTDFVRGLTWFDRHLYSCSWDDVVLKHVKPTKFQNNV
ncbi:methylosome protein 50 [Bombus terrestris]|uniref:Methylosome protein 50 n=1 Tax=Bombus terrestris TaxID=30195 RepID=A0A9B2MLJ9_BOMTE|nr:methylosome protein 50 [Bombus terrestris]XP_012166040.1 methylosome protein 50 [Bombus terrestris]XP_012166041.1 methylosome protein 50 [Bombus terrestris]